MRRILGWLILISLCCFVCTATAASGYGTVVQSAPLAAGKTRSGMVRVSLASLGSPSSLTIRLRGSYTAAGDQQLALADGASLTVSVQSATGKLTLKTGGKSYAMGRSVTLTRKTTEGSGLWISEARASLYPGDLKLTAASGDQGYHISPVLYVYIEDYLCGVVPYEMGDTAHPEALKAQAVAARTYTLSRMNARSGAAYDVVDTTADQVYCGADPEETGDPCAQAVDATRGIVLSCQNTLCETLYTASNGGQTESPSNAWNSRTYAYLSVKDDPFDLLNTDAITRSLRIYMDNSDPGQSTVLRSLLLEKARVWMKNHSISTQDLQVTSIDGITPHTARYGAPSRLYTKLSFDVTAFSAGTYRQITLTFDIFEELEGPLGLSINTASNELWSVSVDGETFMLRVGRYGHGIGMSQRGAMKMGELGYTYDQILGFYYEGSTRLQYTMSRSTLSGTETSEDVPASLTPGSDQAVVTLADTDRRLALMDSPSADGRVISGLRNGGVVTVLTRGSDWCLVSIGKLVGYIPTACLRMAGSDTAGSITPTTVSKWATVIGGRLNLRSGPSYDASVITVIPEGEALAVWMDAGDWLWVQYEATDGWVAAAYVTLSDSYPLPVTLDSSRSARVTTPDGTGWVNLRAEASTLSGILRQVPVGETVTVLSDDGSWCHIRWDGTEGFMMASFLTDITNEEPLDPVIETPEPTPAAGAAELTEGGDAIVTTDGNGLNLRAGPFAEAAILAVIPRDEQIPVYALSDDWCRTAYSGQIGYVMTKFLRAADAPQTDTAWVTSNVNMRAAPTTKAEILTVVAAGTQITVHAEADGWCSVTAGDLFGYISSRYITREQPQVPEATEAPETDPAEQSVTGLFDSSLTQVWGIMARVHTPDGGPVNVRAWCRTDAPLVASLADDEPVELLERGDTWCKILFGEYEGYCMTKFLTLD